MKTADVKMIETPHNVSNNGKTKLNVGKESRQQKLPMVECMDGDRRSG